MKLKKMLLLIIFIFIGYSLSAQTRNQEIIDDINDFLQTIYQGYYEVNTLIDLDAHIGDMRYYDLPTEDPFGTIEDCYFFIAEEYNAPNYGTGVFQPSGNIVGIFENESVSWYSDVNEIVLEGTYRLFTTRDINNDSNVEILIACGNPSEELWIYSWDGTDGERINDKDSWTSVIQGPQDSFTLFDAQGDGILEIRSLAQRDGSETWSWNGQLYGRWANTPIMSDISWFPRDNVIVNVDCRVTYQNNLFSYNYIIHSDSESDQRINYYTIDCRSDSITKTQPSGWDSRKHWVWNQEGWGTEIHYWNKPKEILPGQSLDSFKIESPQLPFISSYVVRGENMLPLTTEYTSAEDSTDFVTNSVFGYTIGPTVIPDPFIQSVFLDTLLYYTSESYTLDWIANQLTKDKYDNLFNYAKTLLSGNHIPWVDSTLHNVLEELDDDSSGNVTSEAYALLRYNTEYLLDNLPEVIAPVLNSLSPSLGFPAGVFPMYDMVTATITGELFTDSSIVYFNGQSKSTTYISDTVLTFPLLSFDIRTAGNYPVWVSNYGANSDTIYFSAVDTLPQPVTPVLDCVRDNGDKTFTAFFGYNNQNNAGVYIALGVKNYYFPYPSDRGQPKVFLPGIQSNAFSVDFDGDNITWTLNGTSVTANKKSTPCP